MWCIPCISVRRFLLFGVVLLFCLTGGAAAARDTAGPVFHDVSLPDSLTLCGEALPLKSPAVREMLDRELTINAWEPALVFMWIKRAGRAFPEIEKRLAKAGMPDDLKYLAVAESSLLPYSESNKAAVGTWQFIEETGVRYGLRKEALVDDRYSLESSTSAALQYLQKLRQEFGSWSLALAAYNCGEARLHREIDAQKVQDYYRLNLPLETERFVFRIAAIKLILQNPQRYGFEIPPEHVYRPIPCDTVAVQLDRPVHITDVALGIGTDFKVIKELNPELTGYQLPTGSYSLKVPEGLGKKMPGVLKTLSAEAANPAKEKKH